MMGVLVSKTTLGVIGIASIAILGYCIYVDSKRRRHPDFKRKLHERRRREQTVQESDVPMPNQLAIEQYFMEQINRSEKDILMGNFERGTESLLQAILICNNPEKLLAVLEQSLPAEVFEMLVCKLNCCNGQGELASSGYLMTGGPVDDNGSYFNQPLYQ